MKEWRKNLSLENGFTIMEIMMVIIIVSIISLIALPIYQNAAPTLALSAGARDVASDLRYAQQMAVTTQIIHSVNFDINSQSYSVKNASGVTLKNKIIDSHLSIDSITGLTDNITHFNATGAATESGNIVLKNSTNSTTTIEIKPSGYVQIK